MIYKLLSNEITYIVFDIVIGSLVAFLGILTYGRTKKIAYMFFVISSFFLYITMVFRVLKYMNIFILSEFIAYGVPLFQHLVDYFPFIFMAVGFLFLLREEKG